MFVDIGSQQYATNRISPQVCREAIHIRVQGLSNYYTLHCETQSVVLVLLLNGPHDFYSLSSVVSIQRLLSTVSYVTTKHSDSQSQVLELVFQFLGVGAWFCMFVYLIPEWLIGGYFLRLVGVAARLFWVAVLVAAQVAWS